LTDRISKAREILGIKFLDHIIIMDKKPAGKAGIANLNPKTDDANQNSQSMDGVFQRIAAPKKRPATASSSSKLFQ